MSGYVIHRKTAQIALCPLSRVFFTSPSLIGQSLMPPCSPQSPRTFRCKARCAALTAPRATLGAPDVFSLSLIHLSAPQGGNAPLFRKNHLWSTTPTKSPFLTPTPQPPTQSIPSLLKTIDTKRSATPLIAEKCRAYGLGSA